MTDGCYHYAEQGAGGEFVHLDRGTLDFGVVRSCPASRLVFAAGSAFLVGAAAATIVVGAVLYRGLRGIR